jgi:hypothetical protein
MSVGETLGLFPRAISVGSGLPVPSCPELNFYLTCKGAFATVVDVSRIGQASYLCHRMVFSVLLA